MEIRDQIRAALTQRPIRIVVGEVREFSARDKLDGQR